MELSTTIATMAVVLGLVLAAGHAYGQESAPLPAAKQTAQEKVVEREAQRRAAVEEQQKRKDAFERACNKPLKNDFDLDLCRAAYKRLEPGK
jgi:hypothetical protein